MKYQEEMALVCEVLRQTGLTVNMIANLIYDEEYSFYEAIELCCRTREYVSTSFENGAKLFDDYYAPALRRVIHEVYD